MLHLAPQTISTALVIQRVWAMPNKATFQIKPIRTLLTRYAKGVICDPFCGSSSLGTYRNDANPEKCPGGIDAVAYLEKLLSERVLVDTLLFDPPYSPRQMRESYGRDWKGRQRCSNAVLMAEIKRLAKQLVVDGGHVLTFGWNSNGMGKPFQMLEILMVAYGGSHNDTICVVERK
jgi:hypothetical protein